MDVLVVVGNGPAPSRLATRARPVRLPAEGVPNRGAATLRGVDVRPLSDRGTPMDAAESLLDLIGHTPMLRLDRTARDLECTLLAKLELFNPGGSSKDRPALAMIDSAEKDGRLQPGGKIVEPTSAKTGVGVCICAR